MNTLSYAMIWSRRPDYGNKMGDENKRPTARYTRITAAAAAAAAAGDEARILWCGGDYKSNR